MNILDKLNRRIVLFIALIIFPNLILSQEEVPAQSEFLPEGEALEIPIIPETYILEPGDGFLMRVSGAVTLTRSLYVTPEGKVLLPVGECFVKGLTLKEARDKIYKEIEKYYKNVDITLVLTKIRIFKVFVTGEVFRPGVYNANPVTRASQIIVRAGIKGTASRGKIRLVHQDKSEDIVNLYEFEIKGKLEANPYVKDGDIIHVSPMELRVTVRGAVFGSGIYQSTLAGTTMVSEGVYELGKGERVEDIIRKAGGVTPQADLAHAYIERKKSNFSQREKMDINLYSMLVEQNKDGNIELENGDILVIPSIENKVYVQGCVVNPGAFVYEPRLRVKDYIGLAGGSTDRGDLKRIKIKRADGSKLSGKKNPVIKRGDTIIVPKVFLKWWQDYLAIVSALTSIIITWLTITK